MKFSNPTYDMNSGRFRSTATTSNAEYIVAKNLVKINMNFNFQVEISQKNGVITLLGVTADLVNKAINILYE